MTFDLVERSNYGGIPAALFEFTLGSLSWRYTSGQNDRTFNGQNYIAIPISHGDIMMSGDVTSDDLTIDIAVFAEVAQLFAGTPPSETLGVTIREYHRGETESPVIWSGLVKSVRQVSQAQMEITCNSLLSTLNRNGLRLSWGRGCPHALYDRSCRVNPNDFSVTAQISSIFGTTVYAPAYGIYPTNWFSGGYISFTNAVGAFERRAIEVHGNGWISLMGTADGLTVGRFIITYPGCDRVTQTCHTKFSNLSNYGGFPHLPTKSPFGGDPVF